MVAISRRSFVEKLGLGLGAALLSPIAETLVNEARGQAAERKIAFFILAANGLHYQWNFTPPEFPTPDNSDVWTPVLDGPTRYTMPPSVRPLEPYRSRMLLLDGLCNENRVGGDGGHSMRFGALSGMPPGNGKNPALDGTPGGPTIDQYIAGRTSAGRPRKSVLVGISSKPDPQYASVFASARDKPEPQFQSPAALFSDLFGTAAGDAAGVNTGALKRRVLFDTARADVARLEKALAAPERQKLAGYLKAIEEFERRESMLGVLSCRPDAPPAVSPAPEDVLESLHGMATLALTCGITNVVGVAVGCGNSHSTFPTLRKLSVGTPVANLLNENGRPLVIGNGIGHEPRNVQGPAMELVWRWCSTLVARTIESLAKIRVGDTTLWDQSCLMITSENAEQHHADHNRWPLVLVGNAGGKLRTEGRFLRFPMKGAAGNRSMADLFCTLATAFGIPTSDFAKGGNERVQGPIDMLMS
jgi:hypothetical protein